jgi:polyvinyl alcohol dehydrogenase (cytochrome)
MRTPSAAIVRRTVGIVVAVLTVAAGTSAFTPGATAAPGGAQWPMFGQNLQNTASSSAVGIGTDNVGALRPKWTFTTGGDVSARAAVVDGVAYVPDWSGHLYAIKAGNGKLIWSKNLLTDYLSGVFADPPAKVVSRTSPFVDTSTHTLYLGTQLGAFLLAVDLRDGALKWKTQLDSHPTAVDTLSPIVHDGVLYVGVSSSEEAAAADPSYPCCSFRGSVVALDATTGSQIWKTRTVPDGYTGGAVWGSTIVPDPARGVVYATTGNNYSPPTDPAFTKCFADGGKAEDCLSPDNHFDSVVALRMDDGGIAWSQRLGSSDDWNVACLFAGANCPDNAGPDFDFGSGVNMFTLHTDNGPKTVIGAGQKSGVYSAFDPDQDGRLL